MVVHSKTSSPARCESKLHRAAELPSRQPLASITNEKTSVSPLQKQPISWVTANTKNHPGPPNRRLRQPACTPSNFSFDRVPATSPNRTQALWTRVQAAKSNIMSSGDGKIGAEKSSKGAKGAKGGRGSSAIPRALHKPDANELSSTSSVSQSAIGSLRSIAESTRTSAIRAITPRHPNFRNLVFQPRGITIDKVNAITPGPFAHFNSTEPPSEGAIDYSTLEGLS
ncbi:MAG: hypothetical protein Q9187_009519, partial [Circinaria calcarea]